MSDTIRLRGEDVGVADRMKALSDPIRWAVVRLLADGERCVCDLETEIGISQSRLSYHLGILRGADVIVDRRSGRWVYYSLVPETLDEAARALDDVARRWRREGVFRDGSRC